MDQRVVSRFRNEPFQADRGRRRYHRVSIRQPAVFQLLAAGDTQRRVAILSFTPWTLHHVIAPTEPSESTDLRQLLMGRRLELGLQKKFVATRLAVNEWTYLNWESGRTTPEIRYMPRIIDFLGFDPHPAPISLPGRLKAIRRNLGLSVKRLSAVLGVDESVVARWERGRGGPTVNQWRAIRSLYR